MRFGPTALAHGIVAGDWLLGWALAAEPGDRQRIRFLHTEWEAAESCWLQPVAEPRLIITRRDDGSRKCACFRLLCDRSEMSGAMHCGSMFMLVMRAANSFETS
jgi:hypothetical protein